MAKEIERKFIVDKQKWNPPVEGIPIIQGYLSTNSARTVRIRIAGDSAYLTIKGKTTGISRDEFEYPILVNDAHDLLKLTVNPPIEKIRYEIVVNDKTWEVDKFTGNNKGLLMAEIELESENEKITLPEWILAEVTGDIRYYNSYLASHPYITWGEVD